ncbi:MAG: hypothetical protein HC923_01700 [Myxococcales bacterium]|nr:hypothetical protein [Myxococcales bacterium]
MLPYFFVRYALPQMRVVFPGTIEAVIVRHVRAPRMAGNFLDTNATDAAWDARVEDWTKEGRFEGAEIVTHEIQNPTYPSIPTFHLACRAALERDADFHLWIEDDALVCDLDCATWPERFGSRELGVYRYFSEINAAFFVTRRSYDARIVEGLSRYEGWTKQRRIERYFRESLRGPRVYLDPARAVRTHRNDFPFTGPRFVAEMVRNLAPDEAHLLDLELGPGASQLPPVGHSRAALAMGSRLGEARGARPAGEERARRARPSLLTHSQGSPGETAASVSKPRASV